VWQPLIFSLATKLDEQFHIQTKAQQVTEYAKEQAARLEETARKYVDAASATYAESQRLYQEEKKKNIFVTPEVAATQ
jgi:orotidine-5'-phosphate decarboxylase